MVLVVEGVKLCISGKNAEFSRESCAHPPVHRSELYEQALCTKVVHRIYAQIVMHNAQGLCITVKDL